ncbi:MAG: hypothetical protein K8R28_04175 [Desulfobacterales bacterium]|jgi:hypothetical protein|nr:hypothetical protein [Desulfobacterales bacterium]
MSDFILPVSFIMFAIFFLVLSKSKKNYQKLVENNDEKFANQVNKTLKTGGYLLIVCSLLWLAGNFFKE